MCTRITVSVAAGVIDEATETAVAAAPLLMRLLVLLLLLLLLLLEELMFQKNCYNPGYYHCGTYNVYCFVLII